MQWLGVRQWKLGQQAGTLVGLNLCIWMAYDFLEEAEPSLLPKLLHQSPKEMLGCHYPGRWIRGWWHAFFWMSLIG